MNSKQTKPWYKRWKTWLYAFAAVAFIGMILDLTGYTEKQEAIQAEEAAVKAQTKEDKKAKERDVAAMKAKESEDKAASKAEEDAKLRAELEKIKADLDEEKETLVTETASAKSEIDTSIFEYATETKVTDAIDINDHVTVFVYVRDEANPGLSTLDIMTQTFDFIQQDDMKGAKTVTIAVKQGAIKIAQYTVTTDKFVPDEDTPMAQLVRDASEIDFMTEEVKEFGKAMDIW